MFTTIARRAITIAAVASACWLAAACQSTSVTGPTSGTHLRAPTALHDDDPSTCVNGYVIVNGHTYCNP